MATMTKHQAKKRLTEASNKIIAVLASRPISKGWLTNTQFNELVKIHNKLEGFALKLR